MNLLGIKSILYILKSYLILRASKKSFWLYNISLQDYFQTGLFWVLTFWAANNLKSIMIIDNKNNALKSKWVCAIGLISFWYTNINYCICVFNDCRLIIMYDKHDIIQSNVKRKSPINCITTNHTHIYIYNTEV